MIKRLVKRFHDSPSSDAIEKGVVVLFFILVVMAMLQGFGASEWFESGLR